jgi:hypothetical protein
MSLFPKFEISLKPPATPATTATFQPKCSKSSDCSNLLEVDSPNYETGWSKVFPVEGGPFWKKDGQKVQITGEELERLMAPTLRKPKNLTMDELRTLHEAKVLFKGTILS